MLLTVSYLVSAYPITPVEPFKASLYDYIGISVYFVLFYKNNNFTCNKFKTAKFGFSILVMFWSSFIKIVYFLDKHR